MNILITNDDGIQSLGIIQLAQTLVKKYKITVVAPDRERSGSSHSLTLNRPLTKQRVHTYQGIEAWQVDGTPADCVKIALDNILKGLPDVVISGINKGPNLGTDVLYSGTVGAALEASFKGIPAIALSIAGFSDKNYDIAANFIFSNLENILKLNLPSYTILNINVPDSKEIKGVKVTCLGIRQYNEFYEQIKFHTKTYYWLRGNLVDIKNCEESDILAIENNFISITPLQADLTAYNLIDTLRLNFNTNEI